MEKLRGVWAQSAVMAARRFVCGHCGSDVSSEKAYFCKSHVGIEALVYICHNCNRPTFFKGKEQVPAPRLGVAVPHLPKDIDDLYGEVRRSTASSAFTAAVLGARKLLMHIAVQAGAEEGKSFKTYVDYLVDNHYTPPNSKGWVDRIRELGNEANHEIVIMGPVEAGDVIKFLELILRFMYEFPNSVQEDQVT